MTPSHTFQHALAWLRGGGMGAGDLDPSGDRTAFDRKAQVIAAAFGDRNGELALQIILEATVFRDPVDERLPEHEYLRHAQMRRGQNQVAMMLLAYLDHAQTLERNGHDGHSDSGDRSPGGYGRDDDGSSGGDEYASDGPGWGLAVTG